MGVEATRSVRKAEADSVRTMLDRIKAQHDLNPERLIADSAYGSGPMLDWLVKRSINPHIPVLDKAGRTDGTWSRADFKWDPENNQYICPEGEPPAISAARQCMFTSKRRAKTKQYAVSMRLRKKVEMLYAHLKRILGLGRL